MAMDNEERQEMAGASEQASTEQEVSVSSDASTSGAVSAADQTPAILANEYRYERLIGEGSNGKTWLGININTGEKLAIKSLKLSQSENLKSFELFKREAAVLASVNIDGVPLFYNSIVSDDLGGECYIIQQYVDSESLLVPLENGKVFDEVATLKLIRQVAVILCALHKNYVPPIIHRDIKPSNILCDIQENGDLAKRI